MIKLLIGGSPCTKWSIAQKKDREVTAEGEDWDTTTCDVNVYKFCPKCGAQMDEEENGNET